MQIKGTGVARAIRNAGGQEKLAEALGLKQQTVGYWLKVGYVPIKHVVAVESITGVPRAELIRGEYKDMLGDVEL